MKKSFLLYGIIISAIIAFLGILVIAGVFGGNASSASSAPSLYDSGYATFGADFYNFVSNNAQEAASAARIAANNIKELVSLMRNVLRHLPDRLRAAGRMLLRQQESESRCGAGGSR